MSENIVRNMQSSQGIINYPIQLHLVGHFCKLYHDARKHEYQMEYSLVERILYQKRTALFRVLTQRGVIMYFCSKTNQMHNISKITLFWNNNLHVSDGLSSIIRSLRLYVQHQIYVMQLLWLLASGTEVELHLGPASKQPQNLYDMYLILYVHS